LAKMSKKEIRGDTFLTNVLKAWDYVQDHQNQFFAAFIVVILIVAGSTYYINYRNQQREKALEYYSEALASFQKGDVPTANELFTEVTEKYDDTREGIYSIYFIGKCALAMGKNPLAIEEFERYREKCGKYDFFLDAAIAGKATAMESEGRYEEAAKIFSDLASNINNNEFVKDSYLRRAADNYEKANKNEMAVDVLKRLLEQTDGRERRRIEVKIKILQG
jgi:outer membrane protein assembly factor BamD (BamD/ComL family)